LLVLPIKTEIVKKPFDLLAFLDLYLSPYDLSEGDVLVVSSKIVSISQGRIIPLQSIIVSELARSLSNEFSVEARFTEVVLREADLIIGGVSKVITTIKNNILVAYGGADRSNVPIDCAVIWPENPPLIAEMIRKHYLQTRSVEVGVIISDSQVVPLRAGTYGVAIGIAGFVGMFDRRGDSDLFGKSMVVTRWNIADNLASSANLVMGETSGQVPIVLIKDAPIHLIDKDPIELTNDLSMDPDECLIFGCMSNWGEDVQQAEIPLLRMKLRKKNA
jgi:coenzyme F420-0:L-glutamate ligase / coenzyme F420-1:gamma-L-glutamate ligase